METQKVALAEFGSPLRDAKIRSRRKRARGRRGSAFRGPPKKSNPISVSTTSVRLVKDGDS